MHWYLLALLVLTYLFNNISLHYGFDNLSYRMELPDELFEIGAEIPISSVVENRKPLTVSFLQVREWFPPYFDIKHNTYSLFIMPFQRVRRTYKVRALKRGLYSLDKVELKLGDFIGLRSEEKRIPTGPRLVVLPARANLDRDIVPLGALSGEVTVRRWLVDDPLMTVGIREYTGAEPRKYLHWPSSLRHGKLMVKEFDYTTDNSAMLLLNMETMKPSWKPVEEELLEQGISLARAVMELLEEAGIPYGFASNAYNDSLERRGWYYPPGLGPNHLRTFLETLGRLHYRIPSFFELTLREVQQHPGNYSTVVIITPRILESYIEPINGLSRRLSRTLVISLEEEHLDALDANIIKYRGRES
ncbi:MAG: DUF58 domain-containing protein [Bacillota bacterium]|jgi:uncharacterized protein (DUF58 family)